jgi:Raffinose synthase or seed imbibition protein Sip1
MRASSPRFRCMVRSVVRVLRRPCYSARATAKPDSRMTNPKIAQLARLLRLCMGAISRSYRLCATLRTCTRAFPARHVLHGESTGPGPQHHHPPRGDANRLASFPPAVGGLSRCRIVVGWCAQVARSCGSVTSSRNCRSLLPLSTEPVLRIDSGDRSVRGSSWPHVLLACSGQEVFSLIERAVAKAATLSGAARPRGQKQLPDSLELFGWCTWDAFYSSVSAKVWWLPLPRCAGYSAV